MSRLVNLTDFATSRAVMRAPEFEPIDLGKYLRVLQRETGRDFATLVHLADNTPFFLRGRRHLKLHILSAHFFGAARIEQWRPLMECAVEEQLECLPGIDELDFVRDFIDPVLRRVTGAVLGFDTSDGPRFARWIHDARDLLEPLLSLRRVSALQVAIGEMIAHIGDATPVRTPGFPEPLLAQLMDQRSEDFTAEDAVALVTVLFVASQTTSQTLGNILFALLGMPPEARRAAVATGWPNWFADHLEGLLRLHASPQFIDRIAQRDCAVGACPFKAGDHIHMHLPSANRDLAAFGADADRPMPGGTAAHVSFGSGAHKCPGAAFARLIIGIALPRLFTRFPDLHLHGDASEWIATTFIRAPASLPGRI